MTIDPHICIYWDVNDPCPCNFPIFFSDLVSFNSLVFGFMTHNWCVQMWIIRANIKTGYLFIVTNLEAHYSGSNLLLHTYKSAGRNFSMLCLRRAIAQSIWRICVCVGNIFFKHNTRSIKTNHLQLY